MARKHAQADEESELDLVPIMNLVLILIPLLLLSVVFQELAVINVTMPQKSLGPANSTGEPPKRLQVIISDKGFTVIHNPNGQAEKPIAGCPQDGPTICLAEASEGADAGSVDSYRWLDLYNELMKLKSRPDWSDHETIELSAQSDIPFGILVKAMDVTRHQRVPSGEKDGAQQGTELASLSELASSDVVEVETTVDGQAATTQLGLFPLVVLGVPGTN